MPLDLISINCRGLKNKRLKRKHIFDTCRKYSVSCLQETHIVDEIAPIWKKEWQGELRYIPGSNRSKGQVILINNSLIFSKIEDITISDRIHGITIHTQEGPYTILNVYGPNNSNEKEHFFNDLTNVIYAQDDAANLIVCGDFNTVLNNDLDIIKGGNHPNKDIDLFNKLLHNTKLYDTFRLIQGGKKEYTWCRTNPFTARRLDYILHGYQLSPHITKIEHVYVPVTDHKGVAMHIDKIPFQRGPGFWKLNTSLTEDPDFLAILSVQVDDFLNSHNHIEYPKKFELLKTDIKNCAIKYSKTNKKKHNDRQTTLEHKIDDISEKLVSNPKSEQLNKELMQAKQELELIHLNKAKGAQLRSRIKWIEEGEKNTKYFLGLEKSKGKANTITELKRENEKIKNPLNILNEIKTYYSTLYTKNPNITDTDKKLEDFLKNIDHPVLSAEDKELCDSEIFLDEMSNALSKLNNDSAPGSDGLPVSLYKVMWRQLKEPLFESIKASISSGKLSVTQRRGVVTLFHKSEDSDRNNLSNWRPITLTNTDYKIYSKLIALRIQKVISTIVHNSQKGYIKGRSISDSIRIIDDYINISNHTKTPGLLVSVDFQKAFDSVEKSAIISTLKRFNFGETFISYIKVLIEDTYACVRNGGWLSPWFETQRGVKQGCCASPYLFILIAELMSIRLRNDKNISNIDTPPFNCEDIVNILLYADDTTLFVRNEKALKAAFDIIDELGNFTGLKLNRKKSLILPVGGYKRKNIKDNEFTWIKQGEYIKILGVYFNATQEASLIEKKLATKNRENKKNDKTMAQKTFNRIWQNTDSKNIPTISIHIYPPSFSSPRPHP